MKVSFLLTAWKEEKTVGQAIKNLVDPEISGFFGEYELLLVAPDEPTRDAALLAVRELGVESNYRYFKDKEEGKPRALNILFKEAKGEYLILTDGEVFFEKGAVKVLVEQLEGNKEIGGVSGRPIALNDRKKKYGYWANLQADAVHKMRLDKARADTKFFPMSGYIFAVRNLGFEFPEDLMLDDAYLSYEVFNNGFSIGYAPEAVVKVKYPDNWKDFIAQKFRSLVGFEQLYKYEIIKPETKSRSFWYELSFFFFPIRYSRSIKELTWSVIYYPIRLYLWVRNRMSRDLARNASSIRDVYIRTESTK